MSARPKYPKPDANNNIVPLALEDLSGGMVSVDRARLRYWANIGGETVTALKIANMPNQIDWIVMTEFGHYLVVEVKQPGHEKDLTDGETDWLLKTVMLIASTKEQVMQGIQEMMKEQ